MNDDDARHRWISLSLPTATFVIGLALGGILVYANSGDTNGGEAGSGGDAANASASTASASSSSPSATGDTVVTVPAACEQAAEKVSEAYTLLRQAVDEVRNFDADKLVNTLNELEDVDAETRPLVDACNQVSVSSSPTSEPTPE